MELVDNSDLITTDTPAFRPLAEGVSAYELWQVQKQRRDLRQEYLDHWNASAALTSTGRPVDAIISPCAPYAAPPHGKNKYAIGALCSFGSWHLIIIITLELRATP